MGGVPPGPRAFGPVDFFKAGIVGPASGLKKLSARYGDPFRLPFGGGAMTYAGTPEAIRAIYSAGPDAFDVFGVNDTAPVFGTTSIVAVSGEPHRRARKLLGPSFKASSMRAYGAVIAEVARAAAARWMPGRPFSMLETTQAITLDVIVRVVFGVQGEDRVRRTRRAVLDLIDSIHVVLIVFPFLRRELGGVGPHARNRRAVAALNAILSEEIAARRRAPEPGRDILGLMMGARLDDGSALGEGELHDQLRALLFAGHETTTVALAWTLYRLHRDPALLARVTAELDALGPDPDPDAFASLPFLEAACQEALRLNPPVVDAARIARRPFDLVGYTIPAGEAIRPSLSLLHACADLYPDPDRYRPDRFLERQFSPFEFIPFGGGARRCLGAAFAMYEMKVVLGTLLRGRRLRLAGAGTVEETRRGLLMGPRGGVPMIVEG
jgi:cytochrome P450 family 110